MPLVLVATTPFSGYAKGDMIGGDATIASVLENSAKAANVYGVMVGSAHATTESYSSNPMTFYGSGSPANGLGGDKCTYINTANSHIWINNAGTWADSGATLRGPATLGGDSGETDATPKAGAVSVVTTGGTAVAAILGPVKGGYIVNPTSAADQGIATAESLFVDPVAAPGSAAGSGNGTAETLAPGSTWTLSAPLPAGAQVRVNAATAGHKFTVVVWS